MLVAAIDYLQRFSVDLQLIRTNWEHRLGSKRKPAYAQQGREWPASHLTAVNSNDVCIFRGYYARRYVANLFAIFTSD